MQTPLKTIVLIRGYCSQRLKNCCISRQHQNYHRTKTTTNLANTFAEFSENKIQSLRDNMLKVILLTHFKFRPVIVLWNCLNFLLFYELWLGNPLEGDGHLHSRTIEERYERAITYRRIFKKLSNYKIVLVFSPINRLRLIRED